MVISLFGSSVRPSLWMRLYNSLKGSAVPFELIFVGEVLPDFEMPKNMHFIWTAVKPAQCWEIGCRYAEGELVMSIEDDLVFGSKALDNAYKLFETKASDKDIVSFRLYYPEGEVTEPMYHMDTRSLTAQELLSSGIKLSSKYESALIYGKDSPVLPFCGLMRKDLWMDIGGIDRRFIALSWELDIAMRVYELGGKCIRSEKPEDTAIEEAHPGLRVLLGQKLIAQYGSPHDRPLLNSFWMKDGHLVNKRLSPVEPFINHDILLASQGNKGRWIAENDARQAVVEPFTNYDILRGNKGMWT